MITIGCKNASNDVLVYFRRVDARRLRSPLVSHVRIQDRRTVDSAIRRQSADSNAFFPFYKSNLIYFSILSSHYFCLIYILNLSNKELKFLTFFIKHLQLFHYYCISVIIINYILN